MSSKQVFAVLAASIVGGVAGAAGLTWFLVAHPSLSWRLVPSTAMLRIKQSVETVTAKRFVLVDDKGESLATLGVESDGAFGLVIRDAESTQRAESGLPEGFSFVPDPVIKPEDRAVTILVSRGAVSETLGAPERHAHFVIAADNSLSRATIETFSPEAGKPG